MAAPYSYRTGKPRPLASKTPVSPKNNNPGAREVMLNIIIIHLRRISNKKFEKMLKILKLTLNWRLISKAL